MTMGFPNGLNRTLALFNRALYDIINSDEIDEVIRSAGHKERKYLKILKDSTKGWKPEQFILWGLYPLLLNCPNLLCDVLGVMVTLDKQTFTQDELKEFFEVKEDDT